MEKMQIIIPFGSSYQRKMQQYLMSPKHGSISRNIWVSIMAGKMLSWDGWYVLHKTFQVNNISSKLSLSFNMKIILLFQDVNDGNTICVDTNKTWCLQPEHHLELVFSVAERVSAVSFNLKRYDILLIILFYLLCLYFSISMLFSLCFI